MVTTFHREVGALIQGEESFERLIQRCRPAYFRLKRDIRETAPRFMPFLHDEDSRGFNTEFCAEPSEDGSEEQFGDVMYVDDIRKHIEKYVTLSYLYLTNRTLRSLTRELPFNVPFQAKVSLIQRFFIDWEDHCQRCFEDVNTAATEELKKLLSQHFGEYAGLVDHVDAVVEELLECRRRDTLSRINWMLELENPPFTNNSHYFASYREKYLNKYKEARQVRRRCDSF
jgi:hypothetical protein